MGLMMLAASPGTTITVEATGKEAGAVIEALATLINSRFGEERLKRSQPGIWRPNSNNF